MIPRRVMGAVLTAAAIAGVGAFLLWPAPPPALDMPVRFPLQLVRPFTAAVTYDYLMELRFRPGGTDHGNFLCRIGAAAFRADCAANELAFRWWLADSSGRVIATSDSLRQGWAAFSADGSAYRQLGDIPLRKGQAYRLALAVDASHAFNAAAPRLRLAVSPSHGGGLAVLPVLGAGLAAVLIGLALLLL